MSKTIIIWFRQDLRREDNPALHSAYEEGAKILPVFIEDEETPGDWSRGAASKWWLHHSLKSLNDSLSDKLNLYSGKPQDILPDLIKETGADAIYWNRCYEPWRKERDKKIKKALEDDGVEVKSFKAGLIWEPWTISTKQDTPYKVFTAFYKNGCLPAGEPDRPLPAPDRLTYHDRLSSALKLEELKFIPEKDWYKKIEKYWSVGEDHAQKALRHFIKNDVDEYNTMRDRPGVEGTSRLSPHLHFGEISARTAWHEVRKHQHMGKGSNKDSDVFLSELGWREFSYNLLYHFEDRITDKPLNEKFENFPWQQNKNALKAWKEGKTGYPIVDAGMRQLWETGWMHNRVRMIVASFLIKDLMVHWSEGEKWFWDCLVDADLANNSASWQWVAGCGADASPFFRIFNPVLQGEKFDPKGEYVSEWCPELSKLPNKYIHKPWEADDETLDKAGVKLGETYPRPIVDHSEARDEALTAYKKLK